MGCQAAAVLPTDLLRAEHRVIERALDVLDHLAHEGQRRNRLDVAAGRELIEFLRTFADDCHHGKEEAILFPALEGVVPGFGPAVVMRHEHDEGRAAVGGLSLALDQADPHAFARHAYAYVSLLRGHIQKEDHCLWPMADKLLDAPAQAAVLAAFERAEAEHMGPGVHERMLARLDALLRACGLPPRAPDLLARTGGGCGCSHAAAPRA